MVQHSSNFLLFRKKRNPLSFTVQTRSAKLSADQPSRSNAEIDQKSAHPRQVLFRLTLREADDEDGVDGDEAEQVAGDHPVDHDHERADDLHASEEVRRGFIVVPAILSDGERTEANSQLVT